MWENILSSLFPNMEITKVNIFSIITLLCLTISTPLVYVAFVSYSLRKPIETHSDILNMIITMQRYHIKAFTYSLIVIVSIFITSYFLLISGADMVSAGLFLIPSVLLLCSTYFAKIRNIILPKRYKYLQIMRREEK